MLVLNEKLLFGTIVQRDENGNGTVKTFEGVTYKIKGSQRGRVESALGKSEQPFVIIDNKKKGKNVTIPPVGTGVYFKRQKRRKDRVVAWVTYKEYKKVRNWMKGESERIEKRWRQIDRNKYSILSEANTILKEYQRTNG